MRTIKFRSWDGKQFIPVCINAEGKPCVIVYPGQQIIQDNCQQFTGLKDKNGKEIYEGDIVKILYSDWASQHLATPEKQAMTLNEYLDSITEIKVVEWSYNGFYVSHKINGYHETMEYGNNGYIEVIGNIFENPELLK